MIAATYITATRVLSDKSPCVMKADTPKPGMIQLPADCSSVEFWDTCVRSRQPCLFNEGLPELQRLQGAVTQAELLGKAGGATLDVEVRAPREAFGRGHKERMTVAQFLSKLQSGSIAVYLSTQEAGMAANGHPELAAPPLSLLPGWPKKPAVTGNLVPHAVNMWMGHSEDGASSGLHHDFHDNLYCLLQGKKRFRLYPPALAHKMYLHGTIAHIFDNGRIVYQGGEPVRADGVGIEDAEDFAKSKRRQGIDLHKLDACSDPEDVDALLEGALAQHAASSVEEGDSAWETSEDDVDLETSCGMAAEHVQPGIGKRGRESAEGEPDVRVDVSRRTADGCADASIYAQRQAAEPEQPPSFSQVSSSLPRCPNH